MEKHFVRNAVMLGLVTAIGPLAIDMYLPALTLIGRNLGADHTAVQLSLIVFFLSLGICQLIYGPVSDMTGRKLPLYFGLVLFSAASIGCALAPDIETLIVLRFLQGVGACAGMVVPRAIVRDLHTGIDATRMMSLLMLVFSVSPILAPLFGSVVIATLGWRWVFWIVLVAGLLALAMIWAYLPETRPRAARLDSSIGSALRAYGLLLRDWNFLGLTFIGSFAIASFFAYLANSPFVLIEHYGLSPAIYSLFFSVNAVSFFSVSQASSWLAKRFGLVPVVRVAVIGFAASMSLLFVVFAVGGGGLAVMAVLLFIGYGFLGLVIPTTSVLALEEHGEIAGTASALLGTLQFMTGAVVMGVVGAFLDGTAMPMVAGIAGCALVTLLLTELTLGRRRAAATMPAE